MSFKFCKNGRASCSSSELYYKKTLSRISTFIFLTVPYVLFAGTGMLWYIEHYGWGIPLFITALFTSSLCFFLISSFSDPGVIPRQYSINRMYDLYSGYKKTFRGPNDLNMMINGKFLVIKYCNTCHIYRSPRTIHCRVCDVCVIRFDHHCKWLGNCVGYYNYRSFIAFISTTFVNIIAEIILSIIRVVYVGNDSKILKGILETVVLLFYIVLSGWFIAGLCVYHSYLSLTNQTTNEQLKGTYSDFNPWNRGIFSNLKEVLFTKRLKGPLYSPRKTRILYNPVSQFTDNKSLSLINKFVFPVKLYPQSSSPSCLDLDLISQTPPASNKLKLTQKKHSTSTKSSTNDILLQIDLRDSFVIENQDSSDLSIDALMDTYTQLKNNLNETANLNQMILKNLTNETLVRNSSLSDYEPSDSSCSVYDSKDSSSKESNSDDSSCQDSDDSNSKDSESSDDSSSGE